MKKVRKSVTSSYNFSFDSLILLMLFNIHSLSLTSSPTVVNMRVQVHDQDGAGPGDWVVWI